MEKTIVKAKLKNLPISPQKVRLVADVIRGKKVEEGLDMLRFLNKSAALPVAKLVSSAAANAEENNKWNRDSLVISKIMVGDGIRRRWRRFISRGRMRTIMRKYCNIEVELTQKQAGIAQPKAAKKAEVKAEVAETKPEAKKESKKTTKIAKPNKN
jgi:large subunit ribosomal protein L22